MEKMDTEERRPYVQIIYVVGKPRQGLENSQSSLGTPTESQTLASKHFQETRPLWPPIEREIVELLSAPVQEPSQLSSGESGLN